MEKAFIMKMDIMLYNKLRAYSFHESKSMADVVRKAIEDKIGGKII